MPLIQQTKEGSLDRRAESLLSDEKDRVEAFLRKRELEIEIQRKTSAGRNVLRRVVNGRN